MNPKNSPTDSALGEKPLQVLPSILENTFIPRLFWPKKSMLKKLIIGLFAPR